MRNFPTFWVLTELENLGQILTGKTPSTKDEANFNGPIPFVKPGDLDNGGYIYKTADTVTKEGLKSVPSLPKNSIMVTCIGNLGKVGITSQLSATNQQINSIIPSTRIDHKFLYHQLCTIKPWLESESSATTVSIINKGKFSKAPMLIAPIAEQKVIAEKLDEMLEKVERIKAHLERVPQILKQFRQSVLADAVSGKLTKDWRKSNQGESKKIVDLLKNRNTHKPKPFEPSDPPYEIHQTWTWVRLGEVFSLKSGTTINQNDELTEGEIPYFKVGDMNHLNNNYYMVTATKFVASNTVSSNSLLDEGMIVFPKRGGAIGTNKKRILKQKSLVDLNTMGINTNGMNVSYVYNWLLTVDLGKLNSGSTVPQINNGDMEPLWIPIPPEKEQLEITKRLETLFAYADKIDKQNASALEKVNDLTQSILAKVFKGELTEKWRKENPDLISGENSAEALLAKIKAEMNKK